MGKILILVLRVFLLALIELVIALIAGYREKKQLAVIAAVNIVTLTFLNVQLDSFGAGLGASAVYAFLTIIATAIEIIIYGSMLNRIASKPLKDSFADSLMFIYTLSANAVSFFAGLYLAEIFMFQ